MYFNFEYDLLLKHMYKFANVCHILMNKRTAGQFQIKIYLLNHFFEPDLVINISPW